jgi:hypothetical protein
MSMMFMVCTQVKAQGLITRLNYGFLAKQQKTSCVLENYLPYLVRIELPTITEIEVTPQVSENATIVTCDGFCGRLRSIANVTRSLVASMQKNIEGLLKRTYTLLPDVSDTRIVRNRKGRGLFNFLGSAASFMFGLSTETDLNEVKQHIADSQLMSRSALDVAERSRLAMQQFVSVSSERLDNLHKILNEEQKSISTIAANIRLISDENFAWIKAQSVVMRELQRYVDAHDSIFDLQAAVEGLLGGNLSPTLISPLDMQAIIANSSKVLAEKGWKLCISHPKDVYESRSFSYTRHRHILFIRLMLPYSKFPPMTVFRSRTFPMPVKGSQGLVTELKTVPEWFIQDRKGKMLGQLIDPPTLTVPIIEASNVIMHHQKNGSCLKAIIEDDTDRIQANCDFSTKKAVIEPLYVRLNRSSFLIHNLTQPQLACEGHQAKNVSEASCLPCVINLSCDCFLNSEEVSLFSEWDCTSKEKEGSVILHAAYNAAALKSFYDLTNATLSGTELVDSDKIADTQSLQLSFFSDNVTRLLAADTERSYSLRKIVETLNSSNTSNSILHSASEAILLNYLNEMAKFQTSFPNFQDRQTYFILAPYPVMIALGLIVIVMYRRYQVIIALLALQSPRPTLAFDLRTTSTIAPTTTTQFPIFDWVQTIRYHEMVLFVIIAALAMCVLAVCIAVKRSFSRKSFLYIDVSNDHHIAQLRMYQFTDATRAFTICLPPEETRLAFRSFAVFGIITFTSQQWTLKNNLTGIQTALPRILLVPYAKLKSFKRIFESQLNYKVQPLIVHTHQYATEVDHANRTQVTPTCPPDYNSAFV